MMADAGQISTLDEVLTFWFDELRPQDWFESTPDLDLQCSLRFRETHLALAAAIPPTWHGTTAGMLAAIIVLDQFPRNLNRGSAHAFAADPLAREVAGRAIARGFDQAFDNPERRFLYMPFMHSEDLGDQERCVALSEASGDDDSTKWAIVHRDIIRDFGRFPHRNAVLGRESSAEEQRFLDDGGFGG